MGSTRPRGGNPKARPNHTDRKEIIMADTELQAPRATVTPTFDKLYSDYRRAKAEFDLAFYTAEGEGVSMPEEQASVFADAQYHACMAVMLTPATNARDLAKKLEIFVDEDIFEGTLNKTKSIAIQLAMDPHELAYR